MGGKYEKYIYKHLMEVLQRCNCLKQELKSVKSTSQSQIAFLNSEVKHLNNPTLLSPQAE